MKPILALLGLIGAGIGAYVIFGSPTPNTPAGGVGGGTKKEGLVTTTETITEAPIGGEGLISGGGYNIFLPPPSAPTFPDLPDPADYGDTGTTTTKKSRKIGSYPEAESGLQRKAQLISTEGTFASFYSRMPIMRALASGKISTKKQQKEDVPFIKMPDFSDVNFVVKKRPASWDMIGGR